MIHLIKTQTKMYSLPLVTQGPFWQHVAEGWAKRDHPNVLFLFYEDMKEDIIRELQRINTFLGTELTLEQLQKVAEHTKFSNMKARPTTNPTQAAVKIGRFKDGEGEFVRKGKFSYKTLTNHFTEPDRITSSPLV